MDFESQIEKLYNQFEELKSKSAKKDKVEVLTKYSKDSTFCFVLEYLLNINKPSGIGKAKLKKKLSVKAPSKTFNSDIKELIKFLIRKNNSMDDISVWHIQYHLNKIKNKNHHKFLSEIITKDYKCGVTDLTAYGIIPGLERNWRVRKGHALKDFKQIKNKPVIVSLKLDGYRYVAIKENDSIEIFSTSGTKIEGLIEIEKELKLVPNGVYDGECIALGEFENSTERFNATTKILAKDGIKTGVEFVIFDYSDKIEEFKNYQKINIEKLDRYNVANSILKDKGFKFIRIIDVYLISNKVTEKIYDDIFKKYEEVIELGEEGLIIDIADAPYVRSKNNSMFKLKPEITGDFKVIALNEGTGKDKGRLGSFTIEYKNNTVNVGSGLTDSIRNEVWNNKDKYINKLIEVTYFGETKDEKTGDLSLRLPRFKRFRHDKNDISYD